MGGARMRSCHVHHAALYSFSWRGQEITLSHCLVLFGRLMTFGAEMAGLMDGCSGYISGI
jgi:hypothetical protein